MSENKTHYRKVFKSYHLGVADLEDFMEAGSKLVFPISHVKQEHNVDRWITLSPLTEMAERFHIKNGASLLERGTECQNFEYVVQWESC